MEHEEGAILLTPLTSEKEYVFKSLENDEYLISLINSHKEKLYERNIEIFHQENNILITEEGYYVAVYTKNLRSINE